MRDARLKVYLNDHLAGAVALIELVRNYEAAASNPALRAFLAELTREIEADQSVLKDVLAGIGGRESAVKKSAARLLEKAGRVKLEGPLQEATLGDLELLDALLLGVRGKLCLWDVLDVLSPEDDRFRGVDVARMRRRAQDQLERIERYRIEAARRAFLSAEELPEGEP